MANSSRQSRDVSVLEEGTNCTTVEQEDRTTEHTTTDDHHTASSDHYTVSRAIRYQLYVSHSLSTWNSRSFEFGAVLFLAHLYPNTLLYLSIYAMIRSASAIVTSTPLGNVIDRSERLFVVKCSIALGRVAIALSAVGFWGMQRLNGRAKLGVFIAMIALSCVEKAASVVNMVAVERDWVVVIAEGHEAALRRLNARMRRIDLICKLVGPLFIALVDGGSTTVAIWITASLSAVSLPIEYFTIAKVYSKVSNLHETRAQPHSSSENGHPGLLHQIRTFMRHLLVSYKYYFNHPAVLPSFALSLLYLTVLSFSGQMVTYLASTGFSPFVIGLVRSLNVVFELSATFIAPRLMKRMGPYRAGMWFLSWQIAWLVASVTFFWREQGVIAASGLAAGAILSRIGLWGYDLSASLIIQTEVQSESRGSFSSTEQLFQNAFELISYALTITFPRPNQFKYPVLVSACAVAGAGALYAKFLRGRRGHLVHTCVGKM